MPNHMHIDSINHIYNFLILEKATSFDELKSNSTDVIDVGTYLSRAHRYGSFRKPFKCDGVKYYHGYAMRGSRILELGLNTEYDMIETNIYYIFDDRLKYNKFIPVYLKGWAKLEREMYISHIAMLRN